VLLLHSMPRRRGARRVVKGKAAMELALPKREWWGARRSASARGRPWRRLALLLTELRIDVDFQMPGRPVADELARLNERLRTPGDALHGLPRAPLGDGRFELRWREDDGELFVYVMEVAARRLAGTTVFNRLVELNRRADRHLRSPHSRYGDAYRRRGLASAVYRWQLDAGQCLISGARQSPGAHALWRSLGQHYAWGYVTIEPDKSLRWLGTSVPEAVQNALHTRLVMLGRGWTLARLAQSTGLRGDADPCEPVDPQAH
jgi:hypothetical protein